MLRRPRSKYDPPLPPPTPDLEEITVTRLFIALEDGIPLHYDLDGEDSYATNDDFSEVRVGKRVVRIATNRILYYSTEPAVIRRPYKPKP